MNADARQTPLFTSRFCFSSPLISVETGVYFTNLFLTEPVFSCICASTNDTLLRENLKCARDVSVARADVCSCRRAAKFP